MTQETKYPEAARKLQEAIFEGLPEAERADWHVAFAEKAATVTDWQAVIDKTVLQSLRIAEPHDTHANAAFVSDVIYLYQQKLSSGNPSDAEWYAAEHRADTACNWTFGWAAVGCACRSARNAARASRGDVHAAAHAARDAVRAAGYVPLFVKDSTRTASHAARDAAWVQIRDAFLNA